MLNTNSAYFKDQLVEKLQLMLATQELIIGAVTRKTLAGTRYEHKVTFIIQDKQSHFAIYESADPKVSLGVALNLLADSLIGNMHAYLKSRILTLPEEVKA